MLREELQLLQEQGSYVGEVVKPMDKKKVLVKVSCYAMFIFYLKMIAQTWTRTSVLPFIVRKIMTAY